MTITVVDPRTGGQKVFWWSESAIVAQCAQVAWFAFRSTLPQGVVPVLRTSSGQDLEPEHVLGEEMVEVIGALELGHRIIGTSDAQ